MHKNGFILTKKGHIQPFTYGKIKRFSITLDFLLLIFWSLQYTPVSVSDIYCKMAKLDQIDATLGNKFSFRVGDIKFYAAKLPFFSEIQQFGKLVWEVGSLFGYFCATCA